MLSQVLTVCQYCQCRIYSSVEHETSWFGILLSLFLIALFHFYSIFLILLLIPLTQTTIHTCPNCLNKIGVRTFYDSLSLSDKVITFQFLGLGIIVTKKQLLGAFVFLFFIIFFYFFIITFDFSRHYMKETWDDYKMECIGKPRESYGCSKYLYRDVNWEGYAVRVDFDSYFFSRYQAGVLVKMNYDKNKENDGEPDLSLKITYEGYEKYIKDILNTTRGNLISFNGTIIKTGDYPIIEVINYKLLPIKVNLPPHLHKEGRYSLDYEENQKKLEEQRRQKEEQNKDKDKDELIKAEADRIDKEIDKEIENGK